jgi:hypothetical protein
MNKAIPYLPQKQTIVPKVDALQWQCGHCQTRNWPEDRACLGCGGELPVVHHFAASTQEIRLGEAIRLQWEVEGADKVQVLPDEEIATPSGMMDVYPQASTIYRLLATNPYGTTEVRLELVLPVPQILRFDAAEREILVDYPTIFHWEVENGAEIHIDRGVGKVANRSFVEVMLSEPGVYTLTARNASGEDTATVKLSLSPPEIGAFYAGSELIRLGQPNCLHWEVGNASKVELLPEPGDVSGQTSVELLLDRSTAYTLRASNYSGSVEASVQLTLPPPRILQFEGNSAISTEGEAIELRWEVENAFQIEILPNIGLVPARGKRKIKPEQAYTELQLVASGHSGRAEKSFLITLFPLPLDQLEITEDPEVVIDMDIKQNKRHHALPDLEALEKEITRTNDKIVKDLQIQRALEMELTEEMLAMKKASVRSELRMLFRKLKNKFTPNQTKAD